MALNRKKLLEFWLFGVVLLFLAGIWFFGGHKNYLSQQINKPTQPASPTKVNPSSDFNKHLYSLDAADSLWAVVNKGRILPSGYVPANLAVPNIPLRSSSSSEEMHVRADAAAALQTMVGAAAKQGVHLMLASGYRSYNLQAGVYSGYVTHDGQAVADASSARPGHSEHQTGLAADLEPVSRSCELAQCFENTAEGQWLAANSYQYGFIIRYPKGDQNLTGYEYEPWHVRYVGVALATAMHGSNQTLEQFFNLPTYSDYTSNPVPLK